MQREWEKVWQAQTTTMYLKSLDHMGIHVKQADKKNFSPKHLVDTLKTKYEEQRRQRSSKGRTAKHQFSYEFSDSEVIGNVLRLMVVYASNAPQHSSSERRRIASFFERFIATFFDMEDTVSIYVDGIDRGTPDDDYEDSAPPDLANGRGRRPANGKKTDLRRGVLDKGRNGTRARGQKDDSATGSKESTPDVDSVAEDDFGDASEDRANTEVTNERWAAVPSAAAIQGTQPLDSEDLEMKADQLFKRDWYNLYCNQNIYVFFSIFQTLYRRFKEVKDSEGDAKAEAERARNAKPAKDIGYIDQPHNYYSNVEDGDSYYNRTLELAEEFVKGEIEEAKYHDILRHYYLKKGWQIYTITDLLKSLCRLGATCSSGDYKEKTPDLLVQWFGNRDLPETSYNVEINLRKQADKYIKDGELFLIRWVSLSITIIDDAFIDKVNSSPRERRLLRNGSRRMRPLLTSTSWSVKSVGNTTRPHMSASSLPRVFPANTFERLFSPVTCHLLIQNPKTVLVSASH